MKKLLNMPNLGLFLLRIIPGFLMAYLHGLAKLPPGEKLISGIAAMGFPLPTVFAWLVVAAELVGAGFIILGLYTRFSSFALAVTMAVAAFVVHAQDALERKELALVYLAISLCLVFTGAGDWSLDKIVRKKS
jgi:putative oxidoreductase